jgi:hypothetical protein
MARPNMTMADLIAAQQKNQLEMSSFVQQQLQTQINSETILKDSKQIQSKTLDALQGTSNDSKSKKDAEEVKKSLTSKTGDGLNSNILKLGRTMKELNGKIIKAPAKMSKEQTEGITNLATGIKTFSGIKERVSDFKKGVTDKFGSKNIGTTLLKSVNVGGIFDKRIEQNEFIKQQKALGSRKAEKTLRSDFDKRNEVAKDITKNENKLEKLKKETGLNESQLGKTKIGSSLLETREKLASKFGKFDKRSQLLASDKSIETSTEEKEKKNRSKKEQVEAKESEKTLSGADEELQLEQAKFQSDQLDLLTKIEENTRNEEVAKAKGGGGEGGGGILSGIGKGLGALGSGLGKLGVGIGKGIVGIFVGLAKGITILGTAVMTGVGAVGLAALAGIILTIAAALRIAAPAIEAFAPVLMKLAEQIGIVAGVIGNVLIEGFKMLPEIIGSIADGIVGVIGAISDGIVSTIDAVTSSIERLGKVDGSNLFAVGTGLSAVALGMAAFAASNVLNGITNMASGLMSKVTGQKTPVEQLEQIAAFGPNLNQAGTGVKNLASGLKAFSGIDADTIEALGKLPIDKIVAASAGLRATNAVAQVSSENKMNALPANAQPTTNVVSAPTNITKQTKNVMVKQSIRNPEGSVNRYFKSRFAN